MLKQVKCNLFNQTPIEFHAGLNIVLGDDEAKNSIGKSSALLVIDFAMGGNSLLVDDAGVIKVLGSHSYEITFDFGGAPLFVTRSTEQPDVVYVCDSNHVKQDEISLEAYREKLKSLYDLSELESSFRSIVGPFARIWNKGEADPDHPLAGASKERLSAGVARLLDLFERTGDVSVERAVLQTLKEKKDLMRKSMTAEIIPRITMTKYKSNNQLIKTNVQAISDIKDNFAGAITAYEALFDEKLRAIQQTKNEMINQRNLISARREKLQRDISGVSPRLAANIALVAEFFPEADLERLEQVEQFHAKIGKLVSKELKSELELLVANESEIIGLITDLDQQIKFTLKAKGTPTDLFAKVFELKEVTDKAREENKFFEQKVSIDDSEAASKTRLDAIYDKIFLEIEGTINQKLEKFNNIVYGPERNPSQLRIKNANSYSFTSPLDTGTGKSYAGLVGFDLSMLSLTRLPFVIHDSMIYKNIEIAATEHIIRILASFKQKQIFLAFDEAKKFSSVTQQLLQTNKVLQLHRDKLLYTKDWRAKVKRT
ncbi:MULTISPECIES: DUF2326 domain-containing protein [unclassified Pseudomonas]|uniref:DUF2326 domain-containing protein n=1 Tax=unclassified Pseudomonas TaxID=196821 RepID=UPI000C87A7BF|nr:MULTISPECIES: DUF2326 domain-containing protein [unclassified Pseudomonas]PMU09857.1 chromosome partitioning protein ParA [Pseudomonas sp. FW305-20]PMU17030.1 chromosome partitioning protein ParA [Pseudomonas sp. FW305-122]PMU37586.1 chromosome partitioning protein ParA [Pseudomonas sp. FW305-47B]PMX61678.1 chromosome partitioning protein ParA [Pseudomonas sp. FW305-33]PMX70514.1 chromosome partitioning protein ParA [Pseudomonas sp. FW305-60]